jgi:hypothetical protein
MAEELNRARGGEPQATGGWTSFGLGVCVGLLAAFGCFGLWGMFHAQQEYQLRVKAEKHAAEVLEDSAKRRLQQVEEEWRRVEQKREEVEQRLRKRTDAP